MCLQRLVYRHLSALEVSVGGKDLHGVGEADGVGACAAPALIPRLAPVDGDVVADEELARAVGDGELGRGDFRVLEDIERVLAALAAQTEDVDAVAGFLILCAYWL